MKLSGKKVKLYKEESTHRYFTAVEVTHDYNAEFGVFYTLKSSYGETFIYMPSSVDSQESQLLDLMVGKRENVTIKGYVDGMKGEYEIIVSESRLIESEYKKPEYLSEKLGGFTPLDAANIMVKALHQRIAVSSNSEATNLRKIIAKETGYLLSLATIKRFYKLDADPQRRNMMTKSLDVVAKYLGYENADDFYIKNNHHWVFGETVAPK